MSDGWLEVPADSPFPLAGLPYGVYSTAERPDPRIGVAVGDWVLDLGRVADHRRWPVAEALQRPTLNPVLAAGRTTWQDLRRRLRDLLTAARDADGVRRYLEPRGEVRSHLPVQIADYVDFYASERHATNLGRILRPGTDPLPAAWRHLPIAYHGRAGTVVVSGTDIVRPSGLRRVGDAVEHGPSLRLDVEAELGFVVGVGSELGRPVELEHFAEHVFGVCVVNDWSARDLQAFEYVPLGPFLGKSFATSLSPWLLPLDALDAARIPAPQQIPAAAAYLSGTASCGYDVTLELRVAGQTVSRPPFRDMYWTPAQMLAHIGANGASLRTGDLFASGTVSGEREPGSLIELTDNGERPLRLADGSERSFLLDGDEVVIAASAPAVGGGRVGLGEVSGRVRPAVTTNRFTTNRGASSTAAADR